MFARDLFRSFSRPAHHVSPLLRRYAAEPLDRPGPRKRHAPATAVNVVPRWWCPLDNVFDGLIGRLVGHFRAARAASQYRLPRAILEAMWKPIREGVADPIKFLEVLYTVHVNVFYMLYIIVCLVLVECVFFYRNFGRNRNRRNRMIQRIVFFTVYSRIVLTWWESSKYEMHQDRGHWLIELVIFPTLQMYAHQPRGFLNDWT